MPQQQEKPSTAPSPGLLRRLLGGPISPGLQDRWPALADAWAQYERNMPEETTWTNRIREMNWLERNILGGGGADAVAWPWGTIALNRQMIEHPTQPTDLKDVLTHELTHIGQIGRGGLKGLADRWRHNVFTPYAQRPEEKEAYAAEGKRQKQYDIHLLAPKKKKSLTGPTSQQLKVGGGG